MVETMRRPIMSNQIHKVKLIGINKEGIKEDLNYPGHVFFPLKLSATLDSRWVVLFRHEYGIYFHNKKRFLLEPRNDELVFDIRDEDDLQILYDIVKEVIENTNRAVDRENVRIAAEGKKREEEDQEIKEKIYRLKEKADKVKL
jgi:hypothetical protein